MIVMARTVADLRGEISVNNLAIARLVGKLDPAYTADPLDPKVKADSDRIAAEVLAKLVSEHKASNGWGG